MLQGKFAVGSVALILSAFSFGLLGSSANALMPAGPGVSLAQPNIELAYYKKKVIVVEKNGHRRWRKDRMWAYEPGYGHRYRYRRAGYGYYYGGWWYPRPYWDSPGPYVGGPGINLCIGC